MKQLNFLKQIFAVNINSENQEKLEQNLLDKSPQLILTQEQKKQLLQENEYLLKEKTKLKQLLKIQQQENEAKEESLYEEILDIYDSLEFLIDYLETNLQIDTINPNSLKRLPKFVAGMREKLLTILSRQEVKKIDFNENLPDFSICQVIDREIRDDMPPKTITKIVRQGFKFKQKILRPIEVITAKSPTD